MFRFLLVLLIGCGGATTPPTTTVATPKPATDPACPVAVNGTSVTVEDTDTGAALVFVTTGDVVDLRNRGALMAQKHNDHHATMGPLPDGKDGGDAAGHAGHDHAAHAGHAAANGHDNHAKHGGSMIGIHSKAVTTDIEGGVKVAFISFAKDIAKLQTELRMHAKHYAAGHCEMK